MLGEAKLISGMKKWLALLFFVPVLSASEAPLPLVARTPPGTFEVAFDGKQDHYYILYRSLDLQALGSPVVMALGTAGAMSLKDRFRPTPREVFYRLQEIPGAESLDTDGDGTSDYLELAPDLFDVAGTPRGNPFNSMTRIRLKDGTYRLTAALFDDYSVKELNRPDRHINFLAFPLHEPSPAVAFINSFEHLGHASFLALLETHYDIRNQGALHGRLGWIPDDSGGSAGRYVFTLRALDAASFETVRSLYHLLTTNGTLFDGNLFYRPIGSGLAMYRRQQKAYEREGIPVIAEDERRPLDHYVALNAGEAYGLLRVFEADERPTILDVALYRELPNDVPLLRGIITETPQTPLSHVNLRAVQNHNPNAYIGNASAHPDIAPLIGKYVRYRVEPDGFEIVETTLEEVEAHLAALRPEKPQLPLRDLQQREILPLEDLGFESSAFVGVKAANLAELTKISSVPRETFPEMGFAVPFAYYDEFMTHNGFYAKARAMMASDGFGDDPVVRDAALRDLRDEIRKGKVPEGLWQALSKVQAAFPPGQGIRARSSTNNEDLPGFNGAGLYESYTHHPDEGHLSKSVKQVYASLWKLLAFEHREFYRVDHFETAMGVLLHPNYEDERANGVAVSRHDFGEAFLRPYYANAQAGEDLVTNPEIRSRPEEWLLDHRWSDPAGRRLAPESRPIRLSASNQVPLGQGVLTDAQVSQLGDSLFRIVNHFRRLYQGSSPDFAMEIEFKITDKDQLAIKQARPWVN